MRILRVTHRDVPTESHEAYGNAWRELTRVVAFAEAKAWLFRDVIERDCFVEFIEWSGDAPRISAELEALDRIATGQTELLEEAGF